MWLGEMIQVIDHLPYKKGDPTLILSAQTWKKLDAVDMLVNPMLRKQRQADSWGFLTSQPYQQDPGLSKRLSQKTNWNVPKEQHPRLTSDLHMHTHIHAYTCMQKHAYIPSHPHTFREVEMSATFSSG